MHVLAVDDQQVDRFLIKRQLSPNFKVTTLSSAREAKAFALIHKFDIALLNVALMDDLDCIDLLKDLKAIQADTFVPFATTCHIDEQRRHKLLSSGFREILPKPLDFDEFQRLIAGL